MAEPRKDRSGTGGREKVKTNSCNCALDVRQQCSGRCFEVHAETKEPRTGSARPKEHFDSGKVHQPKWKGKVGERDNLPNRPLPPNARTKRRRHGGRRWGGKIALVIAV